MADFPAVPGSGNRFPVCEEVPVDCTGPTTPAAGWEARHRHGCKKCGNLKSAVTSTGWPGPSSGSAQQDPEGRQELLRGSAGITGYCEGTETLAPNTVWTRVPRADGTLCLVRLRGFRTCKDRQPDGFRVSTSAGLHSKVAWHLSIPTRTHCLEDDVYGNAFDPGSRATGRQAGSLRAQVATAATAGGKERDVLRSKQLDGGDVGPIL